MAAGSLADVLASVNSQNSAIANAQGITKNLFDQISGQADAIAAASQQAGVDKQTIVAQKAQGELDAQSATRMVAASYGGNPDDVSFIMDKLGQQMLEAQGTRSDALSRIQQKNSVGITDDPLTWLMNKLTINDDINQYNSADAEYEDAVKGLQNINTLNQTTAQSQLAIAKTQTTATVAAQVDQAKQEANIEQSKAKLQSLLYNAQGVEKVMAMGQQQLENGLNAQRAVISSGQLANAQAGLALQREEFGMRSQMWQASLNEKKKADATDAQFVDWYNKGAATMGLKPLDSGKVLAMAKSGGEVGKTVNAVINAGMQSDAIGKPMIAPTPGATVQMLAASKSPLAVVNPAVKPVVDLLASASQQAQNPVNAAQFGVDKSKPQTVEFAVNSIVAQNVKSMSANIKPTDATNIFQAPDIASISKMAAVNQTPFYQKVLQPLIQAGGITSVNADQLMSLARDGIAKGTINMNDAVTGISSVFQSAVVLNNETKDFQRFGIGPQSEFKTTVNTAATFGANQIVNMADKAAVMNALAKTIRNKDINNMMQSVLPGAM